MPLNLKSALPEFPASIVESDIEESHAAFAEYGAVRFRDVRDLDHFVRVSGRFTGVFSPYVGKGGGFSTGPMARTRVEGHETVLTTTGADQSMAIPFHGEMHYTPHPPEHVWFWCRKAAAQGGETCISDGRAALARLAPATRSMLESTSFVITRQLEDDHIESTFGKPAGPELLETLRSSGLDADIVDGRLECRLEVRLVKPDRDGVPVLMGSLLPVFMCESFLLERNLSTKSQIFIRCQDGSRIPSSVVTDFADAANAAAVLIDWSNFDAVLIDNHRVMHGRFGSSDPTRQIAVRLGSDLHSNA